MDPTIQADLTALDTIKATLAGDVAKHAATGQAVADAQTADAEAALQITTDQAAYTEARNKLLANLNTIYPPVG